eukprot:2314433-Amphidinium_carterae.1
MAFHSMGCGLQVGAKAFLAAIQFPDVELWKPGQYIVLRCPLSEVTVWEGLAEAIANLHNEAQANRTLKKQMAQFFCPNLTSGNVGDGWCQPIG